MTDTTLSDAAARPSNLLGDFAAIFFAPPSVDGAARLADRAGKLATHDFYLRIQRKWLRWRCGRADDYLLVAAQSRFTQRLLHQPMLGLSIPGDRDRLPGYVNRHAMNIARLVCRANRPVGTAVIDVTAITDTKDTLREVAWQDFLSGLDQRCRSSLAEDEYLVACFRWFLRWSVLKTATALGLSVAQVKHRESTARLKVGSWVADYFGLGDA